MDGTYTGLTIATPETVEYCIKCISEPGCCYYENEGGYQPVSGMRAWLYNSICFILLSLAMQGTGNGSHTSRTNMGKDVIGTVKSKSPSSKSVEPLRTLYDTVTVVSQLLGNLKAD